MVVIALFRHSAKILSAHEKHLANVATVLPHAIVLKLRVRHDNVVILTKETVITVGT